MSRITDIFAQEILDSRGNPTIEVEVLLEDGATARARPRTRRSRTSQWPRGRARSRRARFAGPIAWANTISSCGSRRELRVIPDGRNDRESRWTPTWTPCWEGRHHESNNIVRSHRRGRQSADPHADPGGLVYGIHPARPGGDRGGAARRPSCPEVFRHGGRPASTRNPVGLSACME